MGKQMTKLILVKALLIDTGEDYKEEEIEQWVRTAMDEELEERNFVDCHDVTVEMIEVDLIAAIEKGCVTSKEL